MPKRLVTLIGGPADGHVVEIDDRAMRCMVPRYPVDTTKWLYNVYPTHSTPIAYKDNYERDEKDTIRFNYTHTNYGPYKKEQNGNGTRTDT